MLACSQGTDPTYCCDNSTEASCCAGSNVFHYIPGNILGTLDAAGVLDAPQPAVTTITETSTYNGAHSTASSDVSSIQSISSSPATSQGASSSQTMTPARSSDSATARTVGLAVGIPLGVLLVGAIGGLFWFFNRRLNQEKAERTKLEEKLTNSNAPGGSAAMDKRFLEKGDGDASHELPSAVSELAPSANRFEMGPGKSLYGDGSSSSATRI